MTAAADPGIFGARTARQGWHGTSSPSLGRVDPPDPPDPEPPTAPYCDGPGHRYGHVAPGYYCWAGLDVPWSEGYVNPPEPLTGVVEPCPSCIGRVRNHRASR